MLLSSIFPLSANAYAPSGTLEYRFHNGFSEPIYAYSSLFRTGRDNFHWLDFAYSETNYQLDDEVGRAMGYSSIYKFAQRQRWHRFFKPAIFVGVGLHRRELT
ncbi:MAG: hypothetical protein HAW61_00945, partial [Candidatus Portiera sp.]|nr:hypothetical protein [Portiera sp.]